VQLLVLWLANREPKLRAAMLWLLPFVVIANLGNERRAATAGFVIVLPILIAVAYRGFPARRKLLAAVCVAIAAVSAVYFPLFWNKTGLMAQPARAIKSQIMPDARDSSSDYYRMAEDANLMATMKDEPIFGYGYGKPFHKVVSMVDLSDVDPMILFVAHDQILWIWMRLGTVGFFCFWIMITSILIYGAQRAHDPSLTDDQRCVALFAVCATVMLLIFGLLDKQLSNVRDMLFASLWVGAMCMSTLRSGVPVPALSKKPAPPMERAAVGGRA
jgi:O-antigen ligase